MINLEELFTLGNISRLVSISKNGVTVNFKVVPLDAANLQRALNAATNTQADDVAYAMEFKKQIIARALVEVNGSPLFADAKNPTREEIKNNLDFLNNNHFSLLNRFYKEYEELDTEVSKELDDEIKK